MKTPLVRIAVACNDRNGMIRKRFDLIQFHTAADIIAEVECPPTCITEYWASGHVATVRLGRYLFSVTRAVHHFGNLIWNAYDVPHSQAYVRFVGALERRGARAGLITVPANMAPSLTDWASLVRIQKAAHAGRVGA